MNYDCSCKYAMQPHNPRSSGKVLSIWTKFCVIKVYIIRIWVELCTVSLTKGGGVHNFVLLQSRRK